MPPEAIDFASRLLQYSPSLRCTAVSVVFETSSRLIRINTECLILFFPTISAWSLCTSVLWWTQRTKRSFTKRPSFPASIQLQTRSSWSITRTGEQVDTRPYQETVGSKFLESIWNIRKKTKKTKNSLIYNVPLHEARDRSVDDGRHNASAFFEAILFYSGQKAKLLQNWLPQICKKISHKLLYLFIFLLLFFSLVTKQNPFFASFPFCICKWV